MGTPQFPHEVQLFSGILYKKDDLQTVENLVQKAWGPIQDRSEPFAFNYSKYYEDELGAEPMRILFSFGHYFMPDQMKNFKLQSNQIENSCARNGLRTFNIDPGYIDLDKIVLATTKPATYRIYLSDGIYAQSTLFFKDGAFHPWPWTYRDYTDKKTLDFFTRVRNRLKDKMAAKNI